ncbi:inositol monophosphatase family protein [Geminocystis sp. GBBB08]|uniref:inositol monophosphatase family protein n=1 Tax=Geminocystis sp. GBBB08 TaxID=2604140 RepID=UPI0027E309DC|nr:inositol monophosphatase family protein [Geminocystis sp. GBBB08]MBL1208293.1 inositol monophosphatase family protein [Geminocystis sp. GBBB08]
MIDIIETLLPTLRLAGKYAVHIQNRIQAQPSKEADNFYSSALTDADLTIQTAIELTLLAKFPHLPFFGEEHDRSYNTKYFTGIELTEDYLITFDPIDGTRAYLDGLPCWSIVLSVIKNKRYEAVLVLQPRRNHYIYAQRGQGVFKGKIDDDLSLAQPLKLGQLNSNLVYVSYGLTELKSKLEPKFTSWCSAINYNPPKNIPDFLDLINGNLAGFIIERGNLIDSACFAFILKELDVIATHFDGTDFEPFRNVNHMKIDGLIIGFNEEIHRQIKILLS